MSLEAAVFSEHSHTSVLICVTCCHYYRDVSNNNISTIARDALRPAAGLREL